MSRFARIWTLVAILATAAIWCAFDYVAAGPDAEWTSDGIAGLSWYVLCLLAFAWIVSLVSRPAMPFSAVVFTVAVVLPFATAAVLAIQTWASPSTTIWGYAGIAMAVVVHFALQFRAARVRSLFVSVWTAFIAASLLIWLSQQVYAPTELWYAPEDEEGEVASDEYYESETMLFAEPERIDAALDNVAPSSGDRPLLYFVGFAGYGEQHVFGAEIAFAARIVDARYATTQRSLLLVNDVDDRASHPLATVSGLERVLKGIASKMQLERDALFLFLTSHGSDDPELSVSNGMLPLRPLTGDALANALDSSGIVWRVIVISACHSGAFIEPLRNDRTIVLTAAAAERTSFGCSDDRDLTYFGEAFFRDALPDATSLLDAFETARRAIAERETSEAVSPSEPQAFVGDEIGARWTEFEPAN